MTSDVANRRSALRRAVRIDVTLLMDGAEVQTHTRDLSVGGMFIVTSLRPHIGRVLTVKLGVPALGADDTVDVTVRWISGDGIGVQFGSLRAVQVWGIQRAVRASLGSMG